MKTIEAKRADLYLLGCASIYVIFLLTLAIRPRQVPKPPIYSHIFKKVEGLVLMLFFAALTSNGGRGGRGGFYQLQAVRKKLCFFTIHYNPSLAYIATFKALNAMRVHSHSYWLVIFFTTNSSRVLARERSQIFESSWKKKWYLMNTLHHILYNIVDRWLDFLCGHIFGSYYQRRKNGRIFRIMINNV